VGLIQVHAGPACTETNTSDVRASKALLLENGQARALAGIFKALSDPTRLRIISALAEREFCVGDLAEALGMEQSAVSHQLSDMRDMGLVRSHREGRRIYYRLDDEHVADLYAQGLAHAKHHESTRHR
jgi:ArsR family transcriptional regulator